MKIIGHSDILRLNIPPLQWYEWACHVIAHKSETVLPPKISLKPADGVFLNTMPSLLLNENLFGVKVVSRYPVRVPSLDSAILLYELKTGKPLALMDANFITAARTGAVAAHSVRLLAKKNFKTVALIGLGNTVRATFKVLTALYPDKKLTVRLLAYKEQHKQFAADFAACKNATFLFFDNAETLIKGSDVVISGATVLEKDICRDEYFDGGCLVVPIHTRGFGNCDLFFDKVFADDTEHVRGFKYFERFKKFAEMTDVLRGSAKGRENDKERILAYNIGISIQDIYFAGKIFALNPNGQEAALCPPTEKFWMHGENNG